MKTNRIPKQIAALLELTFKSCAAAEANRDSLSLTHNSAEHVAADQHDFAGDPANPLMPGKQALFAASKEALASVRLVAAQAKKDAQEFCRQGIALLKGVLGTSYNSDWENAGFLTPSLAVPRRPLPMLLQFRQYFERYPARENAPLNLTATAAQAQLLALQAADLAVRAAEAERVRAKSARDRSQKQLRDRLSALREELAMLLEDDDVRWHEFGFRRPVDGRLPEQVQEVETTVLAPGVVAVSWGQTPRAKSFHVTWQAVSADGMQSDGHDADQDVRTPAAQNAPPGTAQADRATTAQQLPQGTDARDAKAIAVEDAPPAVIVDAGTFSDRQCLLTGLPLSQTILIRITARNRSGETKAAEITCST
jgi:hypothetical protein